MITIIVPVTPTTYNNSDGVQQLSRMLCGSAIRVINPAGRYGMEEVQILQKKMPQKILNVANPPNIAKNSKK